MKSLLHKILKSLIKKAVKELLEELKERVGVDACEPDTKSGGPM